MNHFREQRIKHGYKTQKALADALFVNQTAVSQWERGVTTPSNQLLVKLSELYGVSTDYLLGIDPAPTATKDTPADKSSMMAAFWGGEKDLSEKDLDEMWDDVERFAAFLAEKKRQERKGD